MSHDLDVVNAFYSDLLSAAGAATEEKLLSVFDKNVVSTPTPPMGPGAEGILATLQYFGRVVPDLKWEPEEILQHGNRYTVRSTFTGTPIGPFLSVEQATGKSFKAMSIDILVVNDGRIVEAYHLEDWTSVIAQLSEN